jgi:hypothetical protein
MQVPRADVLHTRRAMRGEVVASGFEIWRGRFVPSAGDATVQLHRTP